MNQADRQSLIERYVAAYNAFDVDGMLALLTPDVVFENVSAGQVNASTHGADEFRQLAEQGARLFAEREQTITAWTFGVTAVVVAIAWRGVFATDVPDGPRAGTRLELQGESEFDFADGLISRIVDRS